MGFLILLPFANVCHPRPGRANSAWNEFVEDLL